MFKKVTLGGILKVVFIVCAFYFVWGCTRPNKLYIGNKYSGIKIEVPPEIVKNKDCTAYKKFIHSVVRPGFVPNDDCPWAKVGKIGYFVLKGLKFAIPRDYLWLGSKEPDGVVDVLDFMFGYPTFKSASASGASAGYVLAGVPTCGIASPAGRVVGAMISSASYAQLANEEVGELARPIAQYIVDKYKKLKSNKLGSINE